MRDFDFFPLLKALLGFAVLASLLLGLESYRSARMQAQRTAEQAALLSAMQALNNQAVSQLVDDWRLIYPEPSEERLDELRDLARQLQAAPDALEAPRASGTQPAL